MTGFAVSAFGLAFVLAAGAATPTKKDPREELARAFFAAAKYQEAIDIYSQLFAEHVLPDYIYNIGRCYQSMGDPDKALQSFREFRRKAKRIDASLRRELESHIKEMEALRSERDRVSSKVGVVADAQAPPVAVASPPASATHSAAAGTSRAEPGPARSTAATPGESPESAVDRFLAAVRAAPDGVWRKRALKVDDEKLGRTERMVRGADASDPRLPEYCLHLATQYAGKHYTLRLQELKDADQADSDSHKVAAGERKLGAAIAATFGAAVDYYLATTKARDFDRADEALLGLALLLQANHMEERARTLLIQLVRNYPDAKASREIRATR